MKKFGYWRDPLCLSAISLYGINRWIIKPRTSVDFWHSHCSDLLVIPAALPLALWIHRRFGWRVHDGPPTWQEVLYHLFIWSVICEGIGPRLSTIGVSDWKDVVAYSIGGLAAFICWHRTRIKPFKASAPVRA